ncbi:MAG: hypothetical protein ACJ8AT_22090 [Hyalangium sp.]|uniref:hypothetical protein n=1 Tax=Hyalangium sp. TaxID=2028555 RepID=UPI00389B2855
MSGLSPSLVRGASAGVVGTLALGGFALVRNAALGHVPPYAARRIAARLVGRVLHRRVRPREALVWSLLLRASYGKGLGIAWSQLRTALPRSTLMRGLILGAGVSTLEHLTFPRVHATLPPRTWTRAEHVFLVAQTLLFGLVTEASLSAMERLRLSPVRAPAHEPGSEALPSGRSPGSPSRPTARPGPARGRPAPLLRAPRPPAPRGPRRP